MVLTWMPWIRFLCGRTCILLWILYGNMVDFSFIVSLYVSDLPNVTIRLTFYATLLSPPYGVTTIRCRAHRLPRRTSKVVTSGSLYTRHTCVPSYEQLLVL